MKQGWEIKKLGEVATYVNGYAFKPEHWVEKGTPIIRIQNLNNPDVSYNYCDFDIPSKYIVERGDILISWSASLGVYEWEHEKGYLNQHIFKVVFDKGNINKYYLKYAVSAKISDMLKNLHGATMKHIVKKDFDNTLIPVPTLAEQEKIVAELDCLSGIIEKKKQQLKELDALAQSIFYEMFGDPVENDKGWEMKRLGDISEVTSFKRVLIEDVVDEGIPFIRGTELSALSKLPNSKNYEFTLFITPEHYNKVKAISGVPKIGDLLIPSINADGLIWVVDTNEPRYYKDGRVLWVHTNQEYSNSLALRYIMSNKLRLLYKELASGATFIELKLFVLRDMVLPFPPQTIQQEFASKIEAIEKQKELIAQSIKETETLFNSRMDYYFN